MKIPKLAHVVILFAALAAAGVCLIALPQQAADAAVRSALPITGCALLSSALTYFMIEVTRLAEK